HYTTLFRSKSTCDNFPEKHPVRCIRERLIHVCPTVNRRNPPENFENNHHDSTCLFHTHRLRDYLYLYHVNVAHVSTNSNDVKEKNICLKIIMDLRLLKC